MFTTHQESLFTTMTAAPFQAGDVVLTSYGTGVIVKQNDDKFAVRLWRIPGKSVGSSALAFLQLSAVRRESLCRRLKTSHIDKLTDSSIFI